MQDSSSTENRAMRSPRRPRRAAAAFDLSYYDTDRILVRQRARSRMHVTRDSNGHPFGQPISDLPSPISDLPS